MQQQQHTKLQKKTTCEEFLKNEKINWKLIDISGKEIRKGIFQSAQLSIDKEQLENGVYFIEISSKNSKTVSKKMDRDF